MAKTRIQVRGLEKTLEDLTITKLLSKGVRKFFRDAGNVVKKEAKGLVNKNTGAIGKSIKVKVAKGKLPLWSVIRPEDYRAVFLEGGTKPHAAPGQPLHMWAVMHGFDNGWHFARVLRKTGTKAHPFMKPGAEAAMPEVRRLTDQLMKDIEESWGESGL